jgi:glycerate 2-kinase
MKLPDRFSSSTLEQAPYGVAVTHILDAALQAVDPHQAVTRHIEKRGRQVLVAEREYDLDAYEKVMGIGIGKAAQNMMSALEDLLDDGLIITKHASQTTLGLFPVMESGHPLPDERSLAAGQRVLALASSLGPRDLLICLISGGGSALVTAPVDGLTLDDLQALTQELLACGARIDEINTLRRRLDRVKGGGLAAATQASLVSLILSDVVGNPLEAIASGPTAPDPTTRSDAMAVIEKYDLRQRLSLSILHAIKSGEETSSPDDPLWGRVQNVIIGSNELASQAALAQARQEDFRTISLGNDWQGEANQVGRELAAHLRQEAERGPRPICMVAGGETTVTLTPQSGVGGRNQEVALSALMELADLPDVMLITLATDGEDGPTEAAGAVVTGESLERAQKLGLEPTGYLSRHDSYTFFAKLNDLVCTGPTGTNVNDLTFLFAF